MPDDGCIGGVYDEAIGVKVLTERAGILAHGMHHDRCLIPNFSSCGMPLFLGWLDCEQICSSIARGHLSLRQERTLMSGVGLARVRALLYPASGRRGMRSPGRHRAAGAARGTGYAKSDAQVVGGLGKWRDG